MDTPNEKIASKVSQSAGNEAATVFQAQVGYYRCNLNTDNLPKRTQPPSTVNPFANVRKR